MNPLPRAVTRPADPDELAELLAQGWEIGREASEGEGGRLLRSWTA